MKTTAATGVTGNNTASTSAATGVTGNNTASTTETTAVHSAKGTGLYSMRLCIPQPVEFTFITFTLKVVSAILG